MDDILDYIEHLQIMRVTDNDILIVTVPDHFNEHGMHEINTVFKEVLDTYKINAGVIVMPKSLELKLVRKEDIHYGNRESNL